MAHSAGFPWGRALVALVLALHGVLPPANGLALSSSQRRGRMVMKMGQAPAPPPQSVKATITEMTAATQQALQSRCSRMDIELPPGAALGVEKGSKAPQDGLLSNLDLDAAAAALERGDRELARLLVEMFKPIEDAVTVAFSTPTQADSAAAVWGKGTRVMALSTGQTAKKKAKATKKKSRGMGFAAKLEAATSSPSAAASATAPAGGTFALPKGTEVLIAVAPRGGEDLAKLQALAETVGMGCCIILLNARLEGAAFSTEAQRDFFLSEFEPVFHLKPPPPATVREARKSNDGVSSPILSRSFPRDWVLSVKPMLGGPRVLESFETRPSQEQISTALVSAADSEGQGFEAQLNALVGKISNIIG